MSKSSRFSVNLFYSYSHEDKQHRDRMQKALALLRKQGMLNDWYDGHINSGRSISSEIRNSLEAANLVVFLLSPSFVSSESCMREWEMAEEIARTNPTLVRIPVILSECAWKDIEGASDLKAIPGNASPIEDSVDEGRAWQEVYESIRTVILEIRQTFRADEKFREQMEDTQFASQDQMALQSVFVFPLLSCVQDSSSEDESESPIDSLSSLLRHHLILIHGDQLSGKTALCRHVFLSLLDDDKPTIYLDLEQLGGKPSEQAFESAFKSQFSGDYSLWKQQSDKTAVIDNLSQSPDAIKYVRLAMNSFDRVVVASTSDTYYAFLKDEERLAEFAVARIRPMTHSRQEELIRRRATLIHGGGIPTDGQIDAMEKKVNSVIISNRILPRYPFFVLSILQTFEGFMPQDLSVTSFSHCYYVLIIAHLIKSGVQRSDEELNSCFNFMEQLAWAKYRANKPKDGEATNFSFSEFLEEYQRNFLLRKSLLNRMKSDDHGVLTSEGDFRSRYMYFYFLGKYLAANTVPHKDFIEKILEKSYLWENSMTLMFLIHHTDDDEVVDDIVIRTMVSLDDIPPATMNREEVAVFDEVIRVLPENVLSADTPEKERRKVRESRDRHEEDQELSDQSSPDDDTRVVNDLYKIFKNNEILGQVLRNRYGRLERRRIREIADAIMDGGLRIVRMLASEEQVIGLAEYLHSKHPDSNINKIRGMVKRAVFIWTMSCIEHVVNSLDTSAIKAIVDELVKERNSPAHDLIGYFLRLDTAEQFEISEKSALSRLFEKHQFNFFRRVLSIRTQWYLNTHHVPAPLEQSVCSILGIRYRARLKRAS